MYNALTVAQYLVSHSTDSNVEMTSFKVEFITYFAHGWYLAIDGRPLISEKVKAYRHGPVIESVHKLYGKAKSLHSVEIPGIPESIKDSDKEFLDGIMMYYGHLNELEMQALCTDDGTPWFAEPHGCGSLVGQRRIHGTPAHAPLRPKTTDSEGAMQCGIRIAQSPHSLV